MKLFMVAAALVAVACAEVYLQENFDAGWEDRWVQSEANDNLGTFKGSAGKFNNDADEDFGIKTSQDAKFYAYSTKHTDFNNEDKTTYIQFVVKHEQNIDCGGGYVKLFPASLDQTEMNGDSPYNVMFGPDICGPGTRKVHVIFAYNGQNLESKKKIPCKFDELSHLYTLVISPDNTYEVRIDGEKVESGNLEEDFDFLPPKMINDPEVSKPEDWVDEKKIADPEDTKPEDWDQPANIVDPEAEKPEDWDDEMDGEWEAPMIPNPEYKGEWKPKMIDNPEYKGEWEHPQIANPDYSPDDKLYQYDSFGVLGLDLWQVKSGTIFDSFLITDDEDVVNAAVEAFKTRAAGEKEAKDAADAAERAAAEEAAAAAAEEEDDAEEIADEEDYDEDGDEDVPVKDEL
jgi:calreticulin